jgi:hypothetical protein
MYWLKSQLNESDRRQIDFRIREIEEKLEAPSIEDNEFVSLDAERYELIRKLGES